jgi:hypothetical protein
MQTAAQKIRISVSLPDGGVRRRPGGEMWKMTNKKGLWF